MPSIYDIDFSLQWERISPPPKRTTGLLAWGKVLLQPLQWARDLFFREYAYGDTSSGFRNIQSYNKGDRVRFNNKVYEALKDNPYVEGPPSQYSISPVDTDYWLLILDDWRGVYERMQYGPRKLVFEYLLNRWFHAKHITLFRQPRVGKSDIYIEESPLSDQMVVGLDSEGTYKVPATDLAPGFYVGTDDSYNPSDEDFIVYYPDCFTADDEAELKALVERYKLYGTVAGYESYTRTVVCPCTP